MRYKPVEAILIKETFSTRTFQISVESWKFKKDIGRMMLAFQSHLLIWKFSTLFNSTSKFP